MEVSVIIPFYNGLNWLTEALESVFNQTFKSYEIIIIDDGSKEDLTDFLTLYGDRILYKKIENSGPGTARNIGVQMAKGNYLSFLDSDDLWLKNKLEEQVRYMTENNVKWSHTSYETFSDKTGELISSIALGKVSGFLFKPFLLSCPIATPCVMIERAFFKQNNLMFSPKMRYGQDYFLWLNTAVLEEIGVVDKILTRVRVRGGNAARKAYCQIYTKAKINEFIHSKEGYGLKSKIPGYIRFIFVSSNLSLNIIDKIFKKNELFSKVIYTPIYIYAKLLSRVLNFKN